MKLSDLARAPAQAAPRGGARSRASMARAQSALLLAGGALALLAIALPHPDALNETAYLAIAAIAILGGAVSGLAGHRLPDLGFQALAALGTLLVTAAIYYVSDQAGSAAETIYFWPVLYVGYFFTTRAVVAQLGVFAISYAALLVSLDQTELGVSRWIGATLQLSVAALLIRYLRARLDRDISLQQATLESTTDGILVVDEKGRMESFNTRFVQMWRIPPGIARSRNDNAALEYVLDQLADPGRFLAKVRELYDRPEAESYDELTFKDGRVFERYSQPQRIEGRTVGRVWSFRDVTERRRFEERLQHLADHDPLTDLFNRRRFADEVAKETARAARYRSGGALLLLDLDDLKGVNDTHGHAWGDEVLRATARLLAGRLRSTDVLARLGGDEFAILLPEADAVHAVKLGEELLEVVRANRVETGDSEIGLTTSIGVVALESIGYDPECLVAADGAMYRAKNEGGDRLAVWDPAQDSTPSASG